jgi:hypothetical protein
MAMCYQRETKLKAVEKKHASRLSQSVSKKQTAKAVEKKPAKKIKPDRDKAKSQSQARKNQSEKKFHKVYGEDDHGESEEELA